MSHGSTGANGAAVARPQWRPGAHAAAGLLAVREHGAEWNLEVPGGVAQNSIQCFAGAFGRVNPRTPALGIDHPDRRDAEAEVIVDSVLDVNGSVFRGKDLDGHLWRSGDDAARWAPAADDDNVGDTKAVWTDLGPDLDAGPKAANAENDKRTGTALRVAMTNFAHVSLHQTAFEVIAVRVRGMAQIIGERDRDGCTHLTGILPDPQSHWRDSTAERGLPA